MFDLTVFPHQCYLANGLLVSNSNYADSFQILAVGMKKAMQADHMGSADDDDGVVGFGSQFDDDRPVTASWDMDTEVF